MLKRRSGSFKTARSLASTSPLSAQLCKSVISIYLSSVSREFTAIFLVQCCCLGSNTVNVGKNFRPFSGIHFHVKDQVSNIFKEQSNT